MSNRNCGECLMNAVEVVALDAQGKCPRCGADYGPEALTLEVVDLKPAPLRRNGSGPHESLSSHQIPRNLHHDGRPTKRKPK